MVGYKKSGFYANEVVILLMSLVVVRTIGQSKFFKGAHNLMGGLQAGYRLVMGRSWTLWAGHGPYRQVMDRLQAGYGQATGGLQAGYGQAWTLRMGYRQAMGRLQVDHGPQGQVMGGLQVGHERVMGGLQADYRQDIDLTGNSLAVGDNREIKI